MKILLTPRVSPLDRLWALSRRERIFLAAGAVTLLLFLIWLMQGEPEPAGVELALAPPVAAPLPAAAPIIAPPAAALPAPTSYSGLMLNGVMASAAIFTFPDGQQRAVPIGRQFLPGLTLKSVGVRHAILGGEGGDMRLELGRIGGPVAIGAPVLASTTAVSSGQASTLARSRNEAMAFRLGLQARKTDGRTTGYAIKPGATFPILERAGMRAGDVLVAVNGQAFDSDEKVLELPQEIAGSYTAQFEFDRGGRRMKTGVEINKR